MDECPELDHKVMTTLMTFIRIQHNVRINLAAGYEVTRYQETIPNSEKAEGYPPWTKLCHTPHTGISLAAVLGVVFPL